MGWAGRNLSRDQRDAIARKLFTVTDEEDNWLNGLCPLHDDQNQSFSYNVDEDVFHCFRQCVEDGDLVDLYCHVRGLPLRSGEGFKAFRREFAADAGVGQPARRTPGETRKHEAASQKGAAKRSPRQNLEIPEAVYEAMTPVTPDWAARLYTQRGWTPEVMTTYGVRLLSHFRKKSDLYAVFPLKTIDRVVIPVRDAQGVLRNLRCYHALGKPPGDQPKIYSWGRGHGVSMLFPPASMLRPGGVLLCEGEGDCLCAFSHGVRNAITQTGKPNEWPEDHAEALAGRDVVIAYDADQAGQKYAEAAAKNLVRKGCAVRIIRWPAFMGLREDGSWPEDHGQDLTDFFVRHRKTLSDFMLLLDDAQPYVPAGKAGASPDAGDDAPPAGADPNAPYMRFFGMSANGRFTFRERILADYLCQENPMMYHDKSGQLFVWNGKHFEIYSDEQLKRRAINALGEEATAARVASCSSLAMTMSAIPHGRSLNDRDDWLCIENGMLNVTTLELAPHDRDYLATIMLPVRYDSETTPKPERWLTFLAETIQTEGPIAQLQEFMGYCLTRQTKFDKCLLLLGPGSDGKSKVIKVLRAMVGEANCSAVSMTGLEDQFQRSALFGKLLNVGTEVTTAALESEYFKAIVTGDPIQASFKHKDSFEFTPCVKLVYAANKLPRVMDNSDGYFRRILPIQFKRQFLENDPAMDPDLEGKLMAELDGIFEWALVGLHRLLAQGRFTMCDETRDILMDYRRFNNPVLGFVQDRCTITDNTRTDIKDLYADFKRYASENGFKQLNRENFMRELETAARKVREDAAVRVTRPRAANGARPYLVENITLNPVVIE